MVDISITKINKFKENTGYLSNRHNRLHRSCPPDLTFSQLWRGSNFFGPWYIIFSDTFHLICIKFHLKSFCDFSCSVNNNMINRVRLLYNVNIFQLKANLLQTCDF